MIPIQFAGQSYQARSKSTLLERCVNLYPEANPREAKSPVTLHGTPGLKPLVEVGSGPIRGLRRLGSDLYVVSGNELYVMGSGLVQNLIGEVKGYGLCRMESNATAMVVATRKILYCAVKGAGIVQLPEQHINGVAYQDGYLIYSQAGTENIWISGIDDATTISALDVTQADAFADHNMGVISDHREVIVFGRESKESFYNAGDATFPFVRAASGFAERGCCAPYSIAKADNLVFFLGNDFRPYVLSGGPPKSISTPAIDKLIASQSSPGSASGFCYGQDGHTFYCLIFSHATIVYDLTTGAWHERQSYGLDRWRVNTHETIWGKQVVGDYETGDLYELDLDTYTDDGGIIRREAIAPPISRGKSVLEHNALYVDMETGVGINSGQGISPQLMLDWTDNDGKTWSNEIWQTPGGIGDKDVRATWDMLGSAQSRHYRLAVSDPVKVAINGAWADLAVQL